MKLNQLKNTHGARKKRKLLGRGPGSGHGKTSCRGMKGQLSRSGGGKGPGYEGGQMPLYRRLPKKGFTNIFRKDFNIINIDKLNTLKNNIEVTPELLKDLGLAKRNLPVKILGRGKLDKKLNVIAHRFSNSAKQAIEKSGGTWKEL